MKQRRLGQRNDGERVAELVTHQHLRLHTIVVERHHQTVGSNGSATRTVTGIDNENLHKLFTFNY